ncbi:MAG: hypothetical protein U0172_04060 [Nitrospiraceae bacterium]
MWKQNFLFRAQEDRPLKETEAEVFHDADPALDSAGMQMERYLSVWVQGDGDDQPTSYTNVYARTATLDARTRVGFLQPIQGRTHQIRQMMTVGQRAYVRDWLTKASPQAWAEAEDHFKELFD